MRITLKGLKVAKFLSEETLAYVATLLIDGKPVATADNNGRGGMTMLRWMKGEPKISDEFAKVIEDFAWASSGSDFRSEKSSVHSALSIVADLLAERITSNRDLSRKAAKSILFLQTAGSKEVGQIRWPDGLVTPERIAYFRQKYPTAVIWHPEPEFFDIPASAPAAKVGG